MLARGSNVTGSSNEELEGLTLKVYLHAVKKGKPVGPRDVMKSANLSSPSVAYRHLQKLEDMGYLQKTQFGEYAVKSKARISGFVWVGRRLVPKMFLYTFVFLAILVVELVILIVHFSVEKMEFKIFFLLLTLITGFAWAVFTVEGYMQNKRKIGAQTE
jgi:hypothetical protein